MSASGSAGPAIVESGEEDSGAEIKDIVLDTLPVSAAMLKSSPLAESQKMSRNKGTDWGRWNEET